MTTFSNNLENPFVNISGYLFIVISGENMLEIPIKKYKNTYVLSVFTTVICNI